MKAMLEPRMVVARIQEPAAVWDADPPPATMTPSSHGGFMSTMDAASDSFGSERTKEFYPRRTFFSIPIAFTEVVDEHLFDRFVVALQNVADRASADEVADFCGEIFGVVAGAFERLGHEDDLQAGLAGDVFGVLDVAH